MCILVFAAIVAVGMTTAGCAKKGDMLQEISGVWQDSQGKETIEVKLKGDAKSLTVNGKSYPVTVENIESSTYKVNLKVQNGNDQPASWSLRQIWADNGSDFNLAFSHDGKNDVLVPKG
jgi:hypothetical protein